MPVLEPSEYDITYFSGKNTTHTHNAGYTNYKRWRRRDPGDYPEDTGEFFKDIAHRMNGSYNLNNKSVLELGSAYGFLIEDWRDLGIEAYGIEVSPYAISQARADIQQYIYEGDARTYLSNFKRNEFDYLISRWFLCCVDDADLPDLISEMNRISRNQVHILMGHPNPDYYNVKTPQEWLDNYDWDTGTVLIKEGDWENYLTKIN